MALIGRKNIVLNFTLFFLSNLTHKIPIIKTESKSEVVEQSFFLCSTTSILNPNLLVRSFLIASQVGSCCYLNFRNEQLLFGRMSFSLLTRFFFSFNSAALWQTPKEEQQQLKNTCCCSFSTVIELWK